MTMVLQLVRTCALWRALGHGLRMHATVCCLVLASCAHEPSPQFRGAGCSMHLQAAMLRQQCPEEQKHERLCLGLCLT